MHNLLMYDVKKINDDILHCLKTKMFSIAHDCLKQYVGGESYFTNIDSMIKSDENLLKEYILYATGRTGVRNVVLSGKIGEKYISLQRSFVLPCDIEMLVLPGGLRKSCSVTPSPVVATKSIRSNYLFIDDTFYSGKTRDAVAKYLRGIGSNICSTYVFYDGSRERDVSVNSLFRYYDFYNGGDT